MQVWSGPNAPRRSTFAGSAPLRVNSDNLKSGTKKRKGAVALSPDLYSQLLDAWGYVDDVFERVLKKYRRRESQHQHLSWDAYFAVPEIARTLTPQQAVRAHVSNNIVELRNFELDGFFFSPYTELFKADNSCIIGEYISSEDGEKAYAYGRIRFVFKHTLYSTEVEQIVDGNLTKKLEVKEAVFVDCDWYEVVEDAPEHVPTGLKRIRRNFHFDSARLLFATHVVAIHVAFWPEDPFADECDTYLVIHQRDRDPKNFVHVQ